VKRPIPINQPRFEEYNEAADKPLASAQRYLQKTYAFLQNNPYTVIMKVGHVHLYFASLLSFFWLRNKN